MTLPTPISPRPSSASATRLLTGAVVAVAVLSGCGSSGSSSSQSSSGSPTTTSSTPASATGFTSQSFASGVAVTHPTPGGKSPVNQPDDITKLGDHIFVAFQNGVGPQGEPTSAGNQGTGNRDSTIVEFATSGSPVAQWDVAGHVDGLTADTAHGRIAVSANEDANAHLYMITPDNSQATTYRVPALPHHGGLDAISFYRGKMLISASAPGTSGKAAPQASYPALYDVTLNSSTHAVSLHGLFSDEARATRANSSAGGTRHLTLTDPDSNTVVPADAPRFGGQFELTSQGDDLEIFTAHPGAGIPSALKLSQSIDDSAWAPDASGTLYVTDGSADLIDKVTGPFQKGMEIVGVTPCDAGNAPASCPGPGFPNNYLGQVDQSTGAVTKFALTTPINPAGLLFVP
jgi:hypothetical protein